MLTRMISMGFDIATMPARMTVRGAKAVVDMPGDIGHLMQELRSVSDEVAREIQLVLDSVESEMRVKASHLDPQQKEQAAELALAAAGQHLGMAAINILRALWLTGEASRDREESGKRIVER
ncbi:MAG: hypothetical protein KDI17_09295 [Halioglobus sp.]|nr:hypothetical protein [Halioglobus sp.]